MARNKTRATTPAQAVEVPASDIALMPLPAAVAEVVSLAGVIAKTLALCGRHPGLSWRFCEQAGEDEGERCRVFAFSIRFGAGLCWEDDCWIPASECSGPEFEARLAALAEKVYAGAAAELANRAEA